MGLYRQPNTCKFVSVTLRRLVSYLVLRALFKLSYLSLITYLQAENMHKDANCNEQIHQLLWTIIMSQSSVY